MNNQDYKDAMQWLHEHIRVVHLSFTDKSKKKADKGKIEASDKAKDKGGNDE